MPTNITNTKLVSIGAIARNIFTVVKHLVSFVHKTMERTSL